MPVRCQYKSPPQQSDIKQVNVIRGIVFDATGEPLPGASVWEKKSPKTATATDLDGVFTLPTKGRKSVTLEISYIGMKRAEVTWHGSDLTVVLEDDTNMLEDVVVTGYQVIDKRASTSAITSIKAEDILRPDAISIDQMLEGQVPDLMFKSNSGETGVAPKIRIRGTSSIIGNREPLWVVDGIVVQDPVPISAEDLNDPDYVNRIGNAIAGLNPQDIERLDILKDASATALYGTKAANGVIVITTKRGREGKPQIRYNNTFTWKIRPRYSDKSVDVMNSKERIALSRQLFEDKYEYSNRSAMVGYEGLMYRLYNGEITNEEFNRELAYIETLNTDWFGLITHDSFSQQHNASVSGGGDRGTYYASLGFMDNDDVVKGTTNRRYSAVVNLDVNFSNWLSASFGIKGNVSEREYYQESISPVDYAYSASRAIPAFNPDGSYYHYNKLQRFSYGHKFNILNELENSGVNQDQSSYTFDANLKFRFTDWLRAYAILSYTTSNTEIESYWGERSWYAAELRNSDYGQDPGSECLMPHGGQMNRNQTRNRSWTTRLQLDANKYFGEDEIHNVSGGVGFEASSTTYKGYSRTDRGFFPDRGMSFVEGINLDDYPYYKDWLSGNIPSLVDNKSNLISAYATVSYNWKRMIFLNANARIDGSNNFGDRSNDKILPIWSASASFDPAQLGFIKNQTWLDRFILKASYGFQGNMLSNESPIMIIKKGPMDAFYGEYTSTVSRNPNPNLKWEKTTSVNLGFDLAFLNNRIEVEGDVYFKRTKDAFMTKTISTVNGYQSYVVNGGNISNDGYSISITGRPIQTRDWQWSVSGQFSRTINSIESLPAGESYNLSDFLNGNAVVKGQPIGTFYSYRFLGLSPVDGGPMFDDWLDHYQDLVGLSKYDTYTQVLEATGSREPYMSGSFSTRLRWKRLYFNASFAYSLGAKTRLFGMFANGQTYGGGSTLYSASEIRPENNLSRDYLDRWMKPGDEAFTNIPAIIGQGSDSYFKYINHWSSFMNDIGVQTIADSYWDMYDYSDYRVVSADYLKLQSVSLSYEVPDRWISPLGLSRLEIHASGNNLHTWCDKKLKGQTPTQGGFTTIQLSDRPSYSFGLNVTF
ncbi:SusC/RagA family TonB-linked outer membrane protein [uncultured Duncaniella sp.]|uniref:SusC/RagA family TonB-linked outer membrane protein n=4 Tax=uncultured Duncaniella sp. TaxID=2768039 RepID=UPI00266F9E8C|nr:SusC/RagA family TonB-linked outer membrane protein [uncultured Duncaniella sp.]